MAIRTITSANLVFTLSIAGILTQPTQLQGYSVDDAFSQAEVTNAEIQLGVDAQTGIGWVPALVPQKFMFLASSPSIDLFEQWATTNNENMQAALAQGYALIPSVGKAYNLVNGVLSGYQPMPSAKKVLAAREFTITWTGGVLPSPVAAF